MRTLLGALLLLGSISVAADAGAAPGVGARGSRIRGFANQWMGTPYRWGGNSRSGIDCSAYLREMYRSLFGVELPRTTRQQISLGVDLAVNTRAPGSGLEPGDLIFYIDRAGTPNHVVVYMGANMITHSETGRGVVIDPIAKVFGRRIVARRFLIPGGAAGRFAAIPPAGPIVPVEIPCPPSFRANIAEVRKFSRRPLTRQLKALGNLEKREICDFRALAKSLRRKGGSVARDNANRLQEHSEWLESIEALKGVIDGR